MDIMFFSIEKREANGLQATVKTAHKVFWRVN